MKKFFTFIAAALFAGSMMAEPIVINATDVTGIESGATSGLDVTLQGINIVWQGAYYNSDGGDGGSASVDFRVYANKSMTLTAESNISKVEIAGYCKAGLTVTANAGTITTGASYASETTKGTLEDPLIVVDEIGATSVTLTCTKQVRAYTLRITLGDAPAVATPVISGDETFTESVIVTITCSTPEADIYYTTDGTTDPKCDCPAAPEYTQQIVLTETTTIMAAAYTGNDWSAVATKTFTKVDPVAEPTDCATAAAAALSVSGNNVEFNNGAEYTINGYVTAIQTAYSDQYHNITFWMADAADGGNVLEAFRAVCASEADAPAVGDKVAVTGKLTKYNTTPEFAAGCTYTIIERAGGEEPPVEEIVIADTLTIAEAMELGMALDSMAVSEAVYAVEGYVINPGAFSVKYNNQSWYMADEAAAAASDFQAYNCYPIQGNDTLKVLAGDKVQVVGKLKKYYNKSAAKYIIEIEKGNASFITMVDGDHNVVVSTEEITVAQALEIGAALADNGATETQYTIRGYISAVNVKSSDAYSDQYKNQSFWVMDTPGSGKTNAEGAFYVYRGKPETEAALEEGTYVEFTCTIKKYVAAAGAEPVIENADQNIDIKVLEAPVVNLDTINVAQACDIALSLANNAVSAQKYAIVGYVAKIKTEYSAQYKNISFFMTDDAEGTYGDLQVYRGAISEAEGTALAAHDRVMVIGKLKNNFYNESNSAQTDAGAEVTVDWKAAVENILINQKVDKVIMNGVVYIVRDGKLYTVQGVQVR